MPEEAAPPPGATCAEMLDWATRTGRISAASRPVYERGWASDPVRYEATMRILAPVPIPSAYGPGRVAASAAPPARQVRAAAPSAAQTASGLDVSRLHPRLQAAAAREGDRAKVYKWIERYAGENIPPEMLELEGEPELAAAVRSDDNEARVAAAEAETAATEAAVNALELQRDAARQEALQQQQVPSGQVFDPVYGWGPAEGSS